MKTAKKIMVMVSAIALRAAIPSPASAQIAITCPVTVRFGQHIECTNGQSRLTLRPNGVTNLNLGCLVGVPAQPPARGQCILRKTGASITKSVKVSFTDNSINIPGPGDNLNVRRWRMARTTTGGQKQTLTFTPTEVNGTVTFNVGARMQPTGSQVLGNYTGTNNVTANIIP